MKQGLLLKEAPERMCVHRCWYCDTWYSDSLEFQLHLEQKHNKMYAWYFFEVSVHNGDYKNPKWEVINKLQSGWCKTGDPKIIRRARFSKSFRPLRRMFVTNAEILNRTKKRTCHCGNIVGNGHYKYCSDKCQNDWYSRTIDLGSFKNSYLRKQTNCADCGTKKFQSLANWAFEMDHIIAIIFGGHPWDERNLQPLCPNCHKEKTATDMKILAWWKAESKYYDISFKIENPKKYVTLEVFCK